MNVLNDKGHKLTADFQYENDTETENSVIGEVTNFPSSSRLPSEEVATKENQEEYLTQVDYVLPIGENAQFEAGFRGNYKETITDYVLREEVGITGVFKLNENLSNIFTYNLSSIKT